MWEFLRTRRNMAISDRRRTSRCFGPQHLRVHRNAANLLRLCGQHRYVVSRT